MIQIRQEVEDTSITGKQPKTPMSEKKCNLISNIRIVNHLSGTSVGIPLMLLILTELIVL